jgi:hypothetical protein
MVCYFSRDNHKLPGEKGTVMHPYLTELYIKALHAEREREAEHDRLVALVDRSPRPHLLAKAKTTHWLTGFPYFRKNFRREEMSASPRST